MEAYSPEACEAYIHNTWAEQRSLRPSDHRFKDQYHTNKEVEVTKWMRGLMVAHLEGLLKLEEPAVCTALNWAKLWFMCKELGDNPSWETFALTPDQALEHGISHSWWICWESGPEGWAQETLEYYVPNSESYMETHWGFDLILVENT